MSFEMQFTTRSTAKYDSCNNLNDASYLRGVTASKLLSGFGNLLQNPPQGWQYKMSKAEADDLYNTSCEVKTLDWFISHSWNDGRWLKYFCITYILNQRALLACLNVAAALWIALTWIGMPVPQRRLVMNFGDERRLIRMGLVWPVSYVASIILWFFAHRIHQAVDGPFFFLDKCCIHQQDPIRKAEGISKLGGFLHKSRRMLVFWSPRYARRLWCLYEIACYSSLHGWHNIIIMPIYSAFTIFVLISAPPVFKLCHFVMHLSNSQKQNVDYDQGLVFVGWFFTSCAVLHVHRKVLLLCQQIKSLKIADAECYCCSVGHQLPNTNVPLTCDRLYVEANIKKWFSEIARVDESEGIEAFESWHGLEMGLHNTMEDCPPSSFLLYGFSVSSFMLLACFVLLWSVRGVIRAYGVHLQGYRAVTFDLVVAGSFGICLNYLYHHFLRLWWQYRQESILLACVAAALGALLLASTYELRSD